MSVGHGPGLALFASTALFYQFHAPHGKMPKNAGQPVGRRSASADSDGATPPTQATKDHRYGRYPADAPRQPEYELHQESTGYDHKVLHSDAFRAMDTDIDVEIVSESRPHGAFISIQLLFEQQEERFSRFRASSLLSRLNQGERVTSEMLAATCRMALEAHEFTAGLFNPMVLPALRAAGYDRTFREVRSGSPSAQPIPDPHDCLVIDRDTIVLAWGQIDLGGIVKGWTADLAGDAFAADFTGVLVNAGGDVRAVGADDEGVGWQLAIERPGGGRPLWEGAFLGGCATSTTLRRRWPTGSGGAAHHLIDPRTGLPSTSPFVQATVWAPEAWRAEVWAKAVLIGGEPAAEAAVSNARVSVLTFDTLGEVVRWG